MKKLTTLCAALLAAATSFAAVEYELQGSVTNDYGWMNADDMFAAFMTDAGVSDCESLTYYKAQNDPLSAPNICAKLTNVEPAWTVDYGAKWMWLKQYIVDVTVKQIEGGSSATTLKMEDSNSSAWRYAVGAFFIDGQRASWPVSADFTGLGAASPDAFAATWKHGYDNPTEVAEGETWTLNAPYKEGETFRGWYDNADGSGDPILTIDATSTGKLYACFGEYIPNVGEVLALEDGKNTKVKATVSYVAGSNFWVQDATGAILCYGKDNGLTEGDVVVLSGEKTTYKNSPELNNAVVESKTAGAALTPQAVTLATLATDYTAYLNKLVSISAVSISRYEQSGSYVNTYITDGVNEFLLYKYDLKEEDYPVGTVLSLTCVVSIYDQTVQLRGKNEWIEVAPVAVKDTYDYPARGAEGEYTLVNNWIYSSKLDNFAENRPGSANVVRGMVAKDGKMYFINRETKSFVIVDGATGEKLGTLPIKGEHLFEAASTNEAGETVWSSAVTLAYNDVKVDNAGNVLIGACVTSSQRFMIYKVDMTTGEATEVINERLWDNTDEEFDKIAYRFDAFGVYGDVNAKAVVMAQDANAMQAFKWNIEGGVAQPAELITLKIDPNTDNSYLITTDADGNKDVKANPGSAPQIFPVDFNYFYLDGNETLPTLFNMKGVLQDDFINCPTGLQIGNNEGDTCKLNQGHNGLLEFQVGDEYFLVMAATNTVGTPNSAFALYKFADSSKSFAEMTPLWFFPNAGMGSDSNGYRTAVPSVEVKDNVATIYLYAGENGYGVYTFTGKIGTGFNTPVVEDASVQKVLENGQIYIIKNGVKYTVLGNVVE